MRSRKNIYIQLIALALAFGFQTEAWGQTNPKDYYNDWGTSDKTIQHKGKTKWHDLRGMQGLSPSIQDNFDNDIKVFKVTVDGSNREIQATHVLIDTIYMHKGATIKLSLPDRIANDNYSIRSYQRWYNLRTDGTFEVKNSNGVNTGKEYVKDLLYPELKTNDSGETPYRFANGYIGDPFTMRQVGTDPVPTLDMYFYYPKDEQYNSLTDKATISPDNKEYLIACDVSGYTDYAADFKLKTYTPFENKDKKTKAEGGTTYHEPTLSHRIIYCVRAIENTDDWRHKFFKEQETVTNSGDQKYLEEYEISLPATRIPDKTEEMVSIASAANAYAVPLGTGETEPNGLTVKLENGGSNTAGIKLCDNDGNAQNSLTLSGNNRIIHFKYPDKNTQYGTESVKDGSTATILVTKEVNGTSYRIARFKLTFKANSVLLTQSQIKEITESSVQNSKPWAEYTYRTPEYLNEHYTFVTGLDFDYDPDIAKEYGQSQVYPYPLGWSESSYGFYDGSATETYKDNDNKNTRDFLLSGNLVPQWGYYAIINDYTECGGSNWGAKNLPAPPQLPPVTSNRKGESSTYHLFVDASDQPGMIARLKFDKQLCPGSELFVSAWVKVAKAYNSDPSALEDNAAMLFTIMGVTNGANGRNTYTPIYRHQTGQIPATYIADENKEKDWRVKNIPGFGNDTDNNQWLHVYFSFANKGGNTYNYDSYALQIDNNSASTAGGDMYIDDIRVYIAPPKAEVIQKSPTCKANGEDALLQMRLDWKRLLSRLGVEEQTSSLDGGKAHVSFCFVDSAKFISAYKALGDNPTDADLKTTFEKSIIPLSYPIENNDGSSAQTASYNIGKLLFDPYYKSDQNKVYAKDATNYQTITDAQNAGHFYRMPNDQDQALTADINCALEPFRTYFLILEENHSDEHDADGGYTPDIDRFKYFYMAPQSDNSCVAKVSFQLSGQNSIKVNGTLSENSTPTFCNGQIVNFGVQLKADTEGSGELKPVTADVYYDWFLGPMDEFQKDPSTNATGSSSIHQALIDFRQACHDATSPDAWTASDKTAEKALLTKQVTDGKLILRQVNLNAHIKQNNGNMFNLVVIPLPVEVGANDNTETVTICTDPLEIELNIDGDAPIAKVGFEDVKYPDETPSAPDLTSTIRVSKGIQEACNAATAMLEIPLRGITLNSGSTPTATAPSFVKSANHPHLYLIDSNDPVIVAKIDEVNKSGTFESHTWPVATIDAINAVPDNASATDATASQYLRFYFNSSLATNETMPEVKFREGYRYTLMAYFAEGGTPSATSCDGTLTFDLKVVPEYQKWIGPADGSGNWHNDDNWLRSTADELHKTNTDATDYNNGYTTSGETYYGFVPLDFTKVTIPEGKQIQLYKVEQNTTTMGSTSHPIFDLSPADKPASITGASTQHIEYDLVAKKADPVANGVAYNCQTYSPYTVDQIHFEPTTEILHAEYLQYSKVWIDYRLTGGLWYTLASPLQSVVAGDWYTQNTGSQTTEYFKEISFKTPDYNRFHPSVYQRAWKQQANMITIGNSGSSTGSTDPKTVAVAGNWSGVYNDVAVPYTPGAGFSVKVLNLAATTTSTTSIAVTPATTPATALFRFPKADTQYSYYENGSTTGSGSPADVRTTDDEQKKAGKLISDELKPEGSTTGNPTITVTLEENTAGKDADYHLIGNPFMAHLSVQKFFAANTNLQSKYWQVTDGNQTAAVGGTDDSDWITNTGTTTTIAPLQSFFVVKVSGNTTNEVTFTADMQVLGTPTVATLPLLTLVATTADGHRSRAVIAYDQTASEEYKADEDAELFLDSNLGDLPSIYTVAGTMAAGINRTSDLWNIPVGTYSNGINGDGNGTVTLSFEGLDRFTGTTLYDAAKKTGTPLHNNSSLTIPANTYGRYFLRAGTPTGNEKIETETIRIYTIARGQLIVTATENLQTVAVYDFAGRLLRYSDALPGNLFTAHLDKGNYIVRATSEHQQQTSKIQIR